MAVYCRTIFKQLESSPGKQESAVQQWLSVAPGRDVSGIPQHPGHYTMPSLTR